MSHQYPQARAGFGTVFGLVLFAVTRGSTLLLAGVQHPPTKLPRAWWIWEGGSHVAYAVTVDTVIRALDGVGP